jgi:peptidoglycan/xylan/chitin deacetylase (PgdA/CDA1 family)
MISRRLSKWRLIAMVTLAAAMMMTAASYGVWSLSRSRDFQLFGKIIPRIETAEKVVALTFDDGPTPAYTQATLDLLREKEVVATFFLMGVDVDAHPIETRAIIAAGHEIGNHTYSHPDMTFASEEQAADEIGRADDAIRRAGYTGEIHVRPPFGKKLIGLPLHLAKHDRATITWDVEPESYPEIAADPAKIAAHVIETARPGSIIILHVMYDSREPSRQALPAIIDGLKARGFRFATVSGLLALEAPQQ